MKFKRLGNLGTVAWKKGIVDIEGKANAIGLNYMSAVYTTPLLNEIWEIVHNNFTVMGELLGLMRVADSTRHYEEFYTVLKTLYIITCRNIPDEVMYIMECNNNTTKEMYAHEFLADFEDLMYDFRVETQER